eukprot:gnl/MRDRNA2_/MRDRNA2_31166_c0_seq1.p1 gnl/MRDRNA2_/MRDRNA2_31166_c0~~gnl/MRDRNA2_/MRDRNA2_31166_c0_seq1.p1  ORF type:complete len:683 (+),score=138.81 gnl/MRDRNA2_/MRDRNA2_31166_c0_seq1:213-2261(+)
MSIMQHPVALKGTTETEVASEVAGDTLPGSKKKGVQFVDKAGSIKLPDPGDDCPDLPPPRDRQSDFGVSESVTLERRAGIFGKLDLQATENEGFKRSKTNEAGLRRSDDHSMHRISERSEDLAPSREVSFKVGEYHDDRRDNFYAADQSEHSWFYFVVQTKTFQWATAFAVVLNCIMLGLEVELIEREASCTVAELRSLAGSCKIEGIFYFLDYCFLVVFSVELGMRVKAYGFRSVASTATGMLDVLIVFTGWISEVIIPLLVWGAMGPDLKAMQVLKMLRVLRAVRILRMLTMFEDLWFIVQSFLWCLEPLSWIMLFMFTVIFLFAILAINFIGQNKDFADLPWLQDRFGSTFRAMNTLFRIMTLDEWYEIVQPLFARAVWTYFFFVGYIAISALALMNLVTAVVVDTSVRRSRDESKEEVESEMFEKKVQRMVKAIESLFETFDVDHSGSLEVEEFSSNAPAAPLIGPLGTFLELESKEDWDDFFFLMSGGRESLVMDDFIEAITKLNQAAGERTSVALIKTAKTREERFTQIRQIVEQEPELVKQVNDIQDDFNQSGIRIARLHSQIGTFQQELSERVQALKSEMRRLGDVAGSEGCVRPSSVLIEEPRGGVVPLISPPSRRKPSIKSPKSSYTLAHTGQDGVHAAAGVGVFPGPHEAYQSVRSPGSGSATLSSRRNPK